MIGSLDYQSALRALKVVGYWHGRGCNFATERREEVLSRSALASQCNYFQPGNQKLRHKHAHMLALCFLLNSTSVLGYGIAAQREEGTRSLRCAGEQSGCSWARLTHAEVEKATQPPRFAWALQGSRLD